LKKEDAFQSHLCDPAGLTNSGLNNLQKAEISGAALPEPCPQFATTAQSSQLASSVPTEEMEVKTCFNRTSAILPD
jgi:hypothetical protein